MLFQGFTKQCVGKKCLIQSTLMSNILRQPDTQWLTNELILLGLSKTRTFPTTIILICPALLDGYKYGIVNKMWTSV